jgi:hypothetical protein
MLHSDVAMLGNKQKRHFCWSNDHLCCSDYLLRFANLYGGCSQIECQQVIDATDDAPGPTKLSKDDTQLTLNTTDFAALACLKLATLQ